MLRGMIVTREGRPMVVRDIQGNNRSPGGTVPNPATYTLQDMDTQELEFLVGPMADDIPLLPRCESCARNDPPAGFYGSAGWRCHPDCPTGTKARAQG